MTRKSARNGREKKDSELHIRIPGSLKRIIHHKAQIDGKKTSEHVLTLISKHYRLPMPEPSTDYECEKCDKKISPEQQYYCEVANLEKFVKTEDNELEIETLEAIPTKILCMPCAQKQRKITQFSDFSEGTSFVRAADRTSTP